MPKALLFDLDNTLYDEHSYVRSGMSAVAADIASRTGLAAATVSKVLLDRLAEAGRERIFDHSLPKFGLEPTPALIAELVAAYRAHQPRLTFYPGVPEMLLRLREQYSLAIVTDGLPMMQKAKVTALQLESLVDTVVYCWEIGHPKPESQGFLTALDRLGMKPEQGLIIGDNPRHDLAAAAAAGIAAVRVRTGCHSDRPTPPGVNLRGDLARVTELESLLAQADGRPVVGAGVLLGEV